MAGGGLSVCPLGEGGNTMTEKQNGPQPGATGAAQQTLLTWPDDTSTAAAQQAGGELGKLQAHAVLRARYAHDVQRAQAALLRLLLTHGRATVDNVRAALGLPEGGRTRWLGAAVAELSRAGITRRAGYAPTTRRVAHARPVTLWELADPNAARAWLRVYEA